MAPRSTLSDGLNLKMKHIPYFIVGVMIGHHFDWFFDKNRFILGSIFIIYLVIDLIKSLVSTNKNP